MALIVFFFLQFLAEMGTNKKNETTKGQEQEPKKQELRTEQEESDLEGILFL